VIATAPAFRCGEFELGVSCRQLRRHDLGLPLERQLFDVLVYLVGNRDRAIEVEAAAIT
jgi:DNA-binding winged helix-turn-helix (wHTH) protein